MMKILDHNNLDLVLSEFVASRTTEWGLGACWYAAAMGAQYLMTRGLTPYYCQGWVIETDCGIDYSVTHAFLTVGGKIVDPHHHLLDLNPRWVIYQKWSYPALALHLEMNRRSFRGGLPIGFQDDYEAMPDHCPKYRSFLREALVKEGVDPSTIHLTTGSLTP